MKRETTTWNSASHLCMALLMTLVASFIAPSTQAQTPARFIGTIAAISGTTLTVKTDAGQSYQVDVPSAAVIKRIEPGQKDLSTAVAMEFADLAVGDRALVKLDPEATGGDVAGAADYCHQARRRGAEAAAGSRGLAAARRGRTGKER